MVDGRFTKPVLGQDVGPDDLEQDSRHVERRFASFCIILQFYGMLGDCEMPGVRQLESWTELSHCACYHSDLFITWKDLDFPHLCPDNEGQLLENGGLAKSPMSILVSLCSSQRYAQPPDTSRRGAHEGDDSDGSP